MKLDVVHILGAFSNAMQITFRQMCLRRDCFSYRANRERRLGRVWWEGRDGTDWVRIPAAGKKSRGKRNVHCNVAARLFAKPGVHLSQFSEPRVHEISDTCVVTTATRWERLLIAGSHGFNLIAPQNISPNSLELEGRI